MKWPIHLTELPNQQIAVTAGNQSYVSNVFLKNSSGEFESSSHFAGSSVRILGGNGTALGSDMKLWLNGEWADPQDWCPQLSDLLTNGATYAPLASGSHGEYLLVRTDQQGTPETKVAYPIEILIPNIGSNGNPIDGEFESATSLRVAKWENAFLGGNNNGSVRNDFIDWDNDRFYVRVGTGPASGVDSVEIATEDCPNPVYNDDPTSADLSDTQLGALSESMILVSDDHDDDFDGSGAGVDDQDGDRTHRVQLGGNLVIKSVTVNGTKYTVDFKVKVPARKKFEVDFFRLNVAGVHTLAEINDAVKTTNERFAQTGVRVDANVAQLPWPNIPNRDPGFLDLFDQPPGGLIGPLTDEYKTFIDATDSDGTNLFFLLSAYSTARGIALSPRQLLQETGTLDGKYIDKAFINSFNTNGLLGYTPAHELMHLLAYDPQKDDDHNEPWWNLLSTGNGNQAEEALWSKRIDLRQEQLIYQHPSVSDIK